MRVPAPPAVPTIDKLSYSRYEAGLRCLARLAWASAKNRPSMPEAPGALLGTAFHAVLRDAHDGKLGTDAAAAREAARTTFDAYVATRWGTVHPLVKLKFREPVRLPFYNVRREQAAALASHAASRSSTNRRSGPAREQRDASASPHGSEKWMVSRDGSLVGQADYIDSAEAAVIDYKSGAMPGVANAEIGEAERRQLRFYAHLAVENGTSITKGIIARGDSRRAEVELAADEVAEEGRRARHVLRTYQAAVSAGKGFDELATPSASSCANCDCIAVCGPFWRIADPAWQAECGIHLEGRVEHYKEGAIQGVRLANVTVSRTRGTFGEPTAVLEQLPVEWLSVGGGSLAPGMLVRIVHATPMKDRPTAIRSDRAATVVWQV